MNLQFLKTSAPRLALLAVLATGIAAFYVMGGHHALTFERLVSEKNSLVDLADTSPDLAPVVFVTAYFLLGIFGLPGSTVLNLTAGLLFGFWPGLAWIVLASTLASTLGFLSFRYLFRGFVQRIVQRRFPGWEDTLEREGLYLVLSMRLLPGIPYSLANLVLAVSPVAFWTYLWGTLLTLLPRYLLYAYAGTHLGDVESPDDLFSAPLIGMLAVLALLPWLARWLGHKMQRGHQTGARSGSLKADRHRG